MLTFCLQLTALALALASLSGSISVQLQMMHCRVVSVGLAHTWSFNNLHRWPSSSKFLLHMVDTYCVQELSYRKQIARQLHKH